MAVAVVMVVARIPARVRLLALAMAVAVVMVVARTLVLAPARIPVLALVRIPVLALVRTLVLAPARILARIPVRTRSLALTRALALVRTRDTIPTMVGVTPATGTFRTTELAGSLRTGFRLLPPRARTICAGVTSTASSVATAMPSSPSTIRAAA
jgi:hypothetical protein